MPLYMAVAGRIGSNRIAADRYGSWPTVRPVLTILALLLIFPFFIAFLFFFSISAASTDIDNALVVVLGVFYALVAARCTKQLPQHGQRVC